MGGLGDDKVSDDTLDPRLHEDDNEWQPQKPTRFHLTLKLGLSRLCVKGGD